MFTYFFIWLGGYILCATFLLWKLDDLAIGVGEPVEFIFVGGLSVIWPATFFLIFMLKISAFIRKRFYKCSDCEYCKNYYIMTTHKYTLSCTVNPNFIRLINEKTKSCYNWKRREELVPKNGFLEFLKESVGKIVD